MVEPGFLNQRIAVVPAPAVADALRQPATRRLTVTVAGYFPDALDHRVSRPQGVTETVVIVCTVGSGWVRIGGLTHRVVAPSALIIAAGEPHAYGASADHPWTIWWSHMSGTDVAELVRSMEVTSARPIVPLRALERHVSLLDEIVSSLERDQSPARLLGVAGAAWKLLTQISVDRLFPGDGDPLQRAMNYLAERLDGSISVPELARMVGVSPSHLGLLFRRATGGGVLAHHTALRMSRARQLLDITGAPIGEVAREVGYDDPFYFSRIFHRRHGMSPSAYRSR